MDNVRCPVCGAAVGPAKTIAHVKNRGMDFKIILCPSCSLGIRYPDLDQSALEKYYAGYNLSNYDNDLSKTYEQMKPVSQFRYNYILSVIKKVPQNYFEIGPGCGNLMDLFRAQGANTAGLEADPIAAEWIKKRSNSIITGFFENFVSSASFPEHRSKYQLIVLSHVLEHIPQPGLFLDSVKKMLDPVNGRLYVEVPNFLKPYSDTNRWQGYCDPGHIFYYSPATLSSVLRKAGFEKIAMDDRLFPPFYPLFGVFKIASRGSNGGAGKKDSYYHIKTVWNIYRLKHMLYTVPFRALKRLLKKIVRRA